MKRIIILAVIFFTALTFNADAKKHHSGVGGYFYSNLAPYGTWIEIDYGVVVWRPTIIRNNWMPYQIGSWVWTSDGWYWNSYEPFGFITYHYGRWYYDNYYGWLWYPDYEWAPAWVEWRYDNDYIGWAPLHPYAVFSISVGITFTSTYYTPYNYWNFVTYVNFCDPYVYNYYVASGYKYRIHSKTKYRNDFVYYNGRIQNRGVDVKYVSVRSGQTIKQRDIIRVTDSKELKRDGVENKNEIRTLDLKRDELVRNDLSRMEIKRDSRKTSVDIDKVKIGKRENVTTKSQDNKSKQRTDDVVVKDRKRIDTKTVVDKIFEDNSTKNDRSLDKNMNTKNDKVDGKKQDKEIVKRNDIQIKQQIKTNSNQTTNITREKNKETVQIKKDNQKDDSKKENKQVIVRQQNDNNNQKKQSNDIQKSDSRNNSNNDNSRDRKRR